MEAAIRWRSFERRFGVFGSDRRNRRSDGEFPALPERNCSFLPASRSSKLRFLRQREGRRSWLFVISEDGGFRERRERKSEYRPIRSSVRRQDIRRFRER